MRSHNPPHDARRQGCYERRWLLQLLDDQQPLDDRQYALAVRHMESCRSCQLQLQELAGDVSWWSDAKQILSGDSPESVPKATSEEFTPPLDFLSPPRHPELLGRLGRYDVERLIGWGGMGVVLRAFDPELHRPVAIKVLAPHLAGNGSARRRFAREAQAAAAVVHEHVTAIHDVVHDGPFPYLVMQYVAGPSLETRVQQQGPLAIREMLRIAAQTTSGLSAAHQQGLVHRDIKPANLLLENGLQRVLITDFGLARAADDASLTRSGVLAGTPYYMSPEQSRGGPIDHRSDLFSLGAVIYFMAAGHPPFRADNPMAVLHRICYDEHRDIREINTDAPGPVAEIINRLLQKNPAKRYADADEAHGAIAKCLAELQRGAWKGKPVRRRVVGNWNFRPAAVTSLVVVLLLAAAGLGVNYFHSKPTDSGSTVNSRAAADSPSAAKPSSDLATETDLGDDFASQLIQVEQQVSHLEQAGEVSGQPAQGDPWLIELQQIESEVTRLETLASSP